MVCVLACVRACVRVCGVCARVCARAERASGSTRLRGQLSPGQDEDTAVVSDSTDDLWFLNEAESEQVSVEMKESALEQGSDGELPQEEEDKEVSPAPPHSIQRISPSQQEF